ncbi:ABC transporter ATP-binding protein [Devosia sp. RR2S18]|uniref:ABC transporter ATP-binding protein n=1 Tax=Devosia rhizosphaerae TaxID=3049774 RepID=UPI0025408604|nr:sn-glycerol-3-phosphate ABC transporter ATP-binding protein UgpC [Devosia sp. RR2S18]WIJ25835.1 sn-glycerol-3-phosphate ABC transporter ATP-binding protein UgpC [Devosia sp. RR2S18]
MADVVLEQVTKSFGSTQVIKGVDLQIASHEFVVMVGPSGCGKSTLLRIIAGLEDVTDGTIRIDGEDVTDFEPVDRGIAMVFQSYALYPHMTVAENMTFGLRVTKVPPQEIETRLAEAARMLQLDDYLDRRPAQLSGGQRQRVAIGRAIVRDPKVFLFDEPLSNLDAELRVHMRLELARLHTRLGSTMIYVTHDQVEAMTLADKIVVLNGGRIEQVGPPLQVFDDPNNMFVAGFIGSPKMNFLPARVTSSTEPTFLIEGREEAAIALPWLKGSLETGEEVRIGIRPQHLRIADGGLLRVQPDVVEQLGDVSYLHGLSPGGVEIVAQLAERLPSVSTTELRLDFDPAQVFVFNDEGHRLR